MKNTPHIIRIGNTNTDKETCVTSGSYTDMDVFACIHAYMYLKKCVGYMPGRPNVTVPSLFRNYKLPPTDKFPLRAKEFVIVDLSNPEQIDKRIRRENIIKVYDHREGYERFWHSDVRVIEPVGACATLIYEEFKDKKIPPPAWIANLLYTAIMENTFCLQSQNTDPRDRAAVGELEKLITLPANWIEKYYAGMEEIIRADYSAAIRDDLKIMENGWRFGQLTFYDARNVFTDPVFMNVLNNVMKEYPNWLLNMPSIKERKNFLATNSVDIQDKLSAAIGAKWGDQIIDQPSSYFTADAHYTTGMTKPLWLRKEIMRELLNRYNIK